MSLNRKTLGSLGEAAAERFLLKKGYKILERNYRLRSGEIDLIALDQNVMVFIEVKTKISRDFGKPVQAVTPHKQDQISRVAISYIQRKGWANKDCRFDVLSLEVSGEKAFVTHYKNAFPLSPRFRY